MGIKFVKDDEFWIYFHDVGEEFFLHYDYWPSVPPFNHVKQQEMMLDVGVRKEMDISDDGCTTEEKYSYFGSFLNIYFQ